MTLPERLTRLDERTGAASFGRFASSAGGYWCVFAGVVVIVIGARDISEGKPHGAGAVVLGVIAVAIGVFVGPRHMFRRLFRRGAR